MTNWDRITARAGWAMLIAFTMLSSYLNARHAQLLGGATTEAVVFHAAIPVVLLLAGLFAETVALSPAVHRPAKWTVVTALVGIFVVTLIASYIAVLAVVARCNPHAPLWVNQALAAVPDAAMVMAGTVVLSLRVRRHGVAPAPSRTRAPSPWRRLTDAAVTRAESVLAVPQVETVVEARGVASGTVQEPVAESAGGARPGGGGGSAEAAALAAREVQESGRGPSRKRSTKPSVDPKLEPFMEIAQRLEADKLVRGKAAVDYARILWALDRGWSPTRIKSELRVSHETTKKVVEAVGGKRPALTAV